MPRTPINKSPSTLHRFVRSKLNKRKLKLRRVLQSRLSRAYTIGVHGLSLVADRRLTGYTMRKLERAGKKGIVKSKRLGFAYTFKRALISGNHTVLGYQIISETLDKTQRLELLYDRDGNLKKRILVAETNVLGKPDVTKVTTKVTFYRPNWLFGNTTKTVREYIMK